MGRVSFTGEAELNHIASGTGIGQFNGVTGYGLQAGGAGLNTGLQTGGAGLNTGLLAEGAALGSMLGTGMAGLNSGHHYNGVVTLGSEGGASASKVNLPPLSVLWGSGASGAVRMGSSLRRGQDGQGLAPSQSYGVANLAPKCTSRQR